MKERTENERMAVLETTVKNMDKRITEIQADIKSIIATLAQQPTLEAEIETLKKEIQELKASTNMWKFLSPTFAAIMGSVLTFLIIQYISLAR